MKSKNNVKLILLMVLGLFVVSSLVISTNLSFNRRSNNILSFDDQILKTSKISGKIHINGNSEWIDFKNVGNCSGLGTSSVPYLIEDLVIDAEGIGSCIFIENSDVHFMILNCTLTNSGGLDNTDLDGGIKLINTSNAKIINNTVNNNNFALYADQSNNTVVIGNTFANRYGIRIISCNDFLAYFNNLHNDDLNVFHFLSTYRFYSEQKFVYKYGGNRYKNYIGNHWNNYVQIYHGSDDNNDGIGDVPIIFTDSTIQEVDMSPLFYSIDNYEIIGIATEDAIPGFNLFFLLGILSIVSLFIIKKVRK
ncbi:MAG: NosD domain-containing protein [Candidatus Odinarchaeota archaeon]